MANSSVIAIAIGPLCCIYIPYKVFSTPIAAVAPAAMKEMASGTQPKIW